MTPELKAHLEGPTPKRILALDGGGVRGVVTIAFLERIEEKLRVQSGNPQLVLSDYFDLIGGTSVGSMLATMLALGYEVAQVRDRFEAWAPEIFKGRSSVIGPERFDARQLVNRVRSIVGNETLDSDKLKTGLVIIAKRVDTGSPWVISNIPNMPYFKDSEHWIGNRHYELWRLIRASTAAPFLFTPVKFTIHRDANGDIAEEGWFVDGGVSPHNNPALQMLMMAGFPSYKLGWTLTPDDLTLISVGTGHHRSKVMVDRPKLLSGWKRGTARLVDEHLPEDIEAAAFATETLRGVMGDSQILALKLLQGLSHPRFSWRINSEINTLEGELLGLGGGLQHDLMRFQRYDLPLEMDLLPIDYDVDATKEQREALHDMDNAANIPELDRLAREAAEKQVSAEDFPLS